MQNPTLMTGKTGLAFRGIGQGVAIYGLVSTTENMLIAGEKSINDGSVKPVVAQTVKETGGWGGAIADGTAAATYTAAATSLSGLLAFGFCLVAGISGGWIGYNAADFIADEIDED